MLHAFLLRISGIPMIDGIVSPERPPLSKQEWNVVHRIGIA